MPYGTINADVIGNSNGMTGNAIGPGFKNRIINGAMVIDQRNAGASVTATTADPYTLDRWQISVSQSSKVSVQQNAGSVTPPAGFINYAGITSLAATSLGSGDYFGFRQFIEGLNVADLGWGTANAKAVTLSFWVRSSLTGTFGGSLKNSGNSRSYAFTYSITAANTWELKTITVSGDTTGTWLTTNGVGLTVTFGLGVGSTFSGTAGSWSASNFWSATGAVSVVGTNGATFYITGVQLEVGETATSFDRRPYGTEFALCQRYFFTVGGTTSAPWATPQISGAGASAAAIFFPVTMRGAPNLTVVGTGFQAQDNSLGPVTATVTLSTASPYGAHLGYTHASLTSNAARNLLFSNATSYLQFSSEL